MLALCLMLLATYYAQNYADIIGWSLDYIYSSHCGVYEVVNYYSSIVIVECVRLLTI